MSQSNAVRTYASVFLDLSAQVSNESDEDSDPGSETESSFVDDFEPIISRRPLRLALQDKLSDDGKSAETIARDIEQRARKRRRTEDERPWEVDAQEYGNHATCSLFRDGVDVDDSAYELYYIRATRPAVEARTFRDHFPAHCTAFHIPWIPRRVYLWVPNEGAIHDMFYRCARPNDGRARVRVPSEEHQALFSMLGTKVPSYMVGQWVTVKKGTFAGDFGIVERIVHEGLAVELAVMARVDDSPEHSKSSRPMKRLATLLWLRQTFKTETIDHHEDGTYSFRKGRYRDGLHLLRLPIWRVQPAFPCLHDIHPFALKHLGELQDVECYVQVTDVVAVHSGPLRNLVGVVVERTGTEVLIRDVRRINFDNKNEEEDWIEGSTDIQDEKTYWDKLRDMRRTDVLWEIEHTPQDGRFDERCTTHIRSLRRFLDVGDEVLVKVGVHCGKIGIITGQHGDMIDIQTTRRILTDQDELQFTVRRFWVQTIVPEPMRYNPSGIQSRDRLGASREGEQEQDAHAVPLTLLPFIPMEREHLFNLDEVVCICVGKHAGRWGKVVNVETSGNVHVLIRGRNGQEDDVVRCSCDMLYKWTVDDLTDGKLPDASSKLIYERTARSRFVGTYVFVWRRGEDSLAVREAKGSYAFVLDVDQERSMARISYQNREAILPLKSLVSLDYLCCLDSDAPLKPDERWRLFRQVSEHQARHGSRVSRFPGLVQSPAPEASVETEKPKSKALEPITDFTRPGFWIFHPLVRGFFPDHKVFVRSSKQDRAGYLTGDDIGEDHTCCFGAHDKCTVRVHIVRGSIVSEMSVEVSELEPCRPVKKNEKVLHVRGLEGAPVRLLVATGVPKRRDQQLTVCLPEDEKRTWYLHGWQVTKIEKK